MRKAAQRGTMVTEGDSGAMLVSHRLYERKPWWLIARALIRFERLGSIGFVRVYAPLVVLLSNGSVFDIITRRR